MLPTILLQRISYCNVEHRQPEVDWCEVLVLLHEEVGPVADVEVTDYESELGETEDEVGQVIHWEVALPQLAWSGQKPVPEVVVIVVIIDKPQAKSQSNSKGKRNLASGLSLKSNLIDHPPHTTNRTCNF